jgi:hypothetical protein
VATSSKKTRTKQAQDEEDDNEDDEDARDNEDNEDDSNKTDAQKREDAFREMIARRRGKRNGSRSGS